MRPFIWTRSFKGHAYRRVRPLLMLLTTSRLYQGTKITLFTSSAEPFQGSSNEEHPFDKGGLQGMRPLRACDLFIRGCALSAQVTSSSEDAPSRDAPFHEGRTLQYLRPSTQAEPSEGRALQHRLSHLRSAPCHIGRAFRGLRPFIEVKPFEGYALS